MNEVNIINIELAKEQYKNKCPYEMTPLGITIHETDNNASARNEIAYMQRNTNEVSFHFAVDENEVVQGLPLDRNGWHAGDGGAGPGNRTTIAIEICRNHRTEDLTNYYAARKNAEVLVGYLLDKYGWTDKDIYTHQDWSGKNCPRVILREVYLPTFKKNAMAHKDGLKVNPVIEPSEKFQEYNLIISGKVWLYKQDNKSSWYEIPSGVTRAVRVIGESNGMLQVSSKDFTPNIVWIEKSRSTAKPKSNIGKTVQLRGRVDLYSVTGVKYPTPSGRDRNPKILEDRNGMFKIRVDAFTPSEVWVKKNDVRVV